MRVFEVRFTWIRGHAGEPENQRADHLSMQAAQGADLAADVGYEATHQIGSATASLF